MDTVEIYALVCPQTQRVRYVGKSSSAQGRFHQHLCAARNENRFAKSHLYRWIRTLLMEGKQPGLRILEKTEASLWVEREKHWIAFFRLDTLCNINAGGFEPPSMRGTIRSEKRLQQLLQKKKVENPLMKQKKRKVRPLPKSVQEQPTLTIAQAAELLGHTVKTLQRWDREGRLRPISRTQTNRRVYTLAQLRASQGLDIHGQPLGGEGVPLPPEKEDAACL